jgi:hypothetical protein
LAVKTKGAPPKNLTGQMPVSSIDSPWWDHVASEITSPHVLGGKTLTVEELTQFIPPYPDGRRARPRTVARRLRRVLELVSRGPNGSRGKGATYRVMLPEAPKPVIEADCTVASDDDWLQQSIERMTRGSK